MITVHHSFTLKTGRFNNLVAFVNPDNSVVIVAQNETDADKELHIKVGDKMLSPVLKSNSFNTFFIPNNDSR